MLQLEMGGQGSLCQICKTLRALYALYMEFPVWWYFSSNPYRIYNIWVPAGDVEGLADHTYHIIHIFLQPHLLKDPRQKINLPL